MCKDALDLLMEDAERIVRDHEAKINPNPAAVVDAVSGAVEADLSAAAVHIAGEAAEAFGSGVCAKDFVLEMLEIMDRCLLGKAVAELAEAGLWPWTR